MCAMLEHSRETYRPLPLELRVPTPRSRTSSRTSPYQAAARVRKLSIEQDIRDGVRSPPKTRNHNANVLQSKSVNVTTNSPPMLDAIKAGAPWGVAEKKKAGKENVLADRSMGPPPLPLTKPSPGTRRNALGWSKRKTPKKGENKENEMNTSMTMVMR
jgi:hypothetical protein